MNLKKIIVTIAIVACVGSTFAQGFGGGGQGRRGGMFGQGGGSPVMLLQREDVQAELKLTDDQKTKLGGLQEKMRDKMREVFASIGGGGGERPDPAKMREAMTKVNEELQKEVDGILNDDQKKRLRELAIQRGGNAAVMNPEVAKEIGLTDEQKTKIQGLMQKQQEANQSLFEKMRDGELDRDQLREKMQANQKALDEEIGKVLTDAQKTKLKEMAGKPFTFAPDRPRGGGR